MDHKTQMAPHAPTVVATEKGERERLKAVYGNAWTVDEFSLQFIVLERYDKSETVLLVQNRRTHAVGTIMYQNNPKVYFNFRKKSEAKERLGAKGLMFSVMGGM